MRISDWSSDVCSSDLPVRRSRTMNEETNVRRAGSALEADVVRDALALYEPPFTFDHGYIYDAKDRMVMDAHRRTNEAGHTSIEMRVRGWGRIGYMPNGAALQDAVGVQMAEALTSHWLARND